MRGGDGIPTTLCLFDQSFLYEEGGDLLLTRFRGSRSKMSEYYTLYTEQYRRKEKMEAEKRKKKVNREVKNE